MSILYERAPLKTEKILFAIVDQTNLESKHNIFFKKLYDITFSYTSRVSQNLNKDIKFFKNIDDAMSESITYDLIVIQNVGNFLRNNEFLLHLENYYYKNKDFFVLGFVLDWPAEGKEGWLELHNQMMVVNPRVWKSIQSPKYGDWLETTEELPNYSRSDENFHDKYTPYWVKGEEGSSIQRRNKQGWGFIKAALSHGIKLDNFSQEMRDCRLYIYPETNTENLYNAFIEKNLLLVENPNQKKWIKESTPKITIWIYNSEYYKFDRDLTGCDFYIGPASGFKYLDALNYNDKIKFLFYDYNQSSLNWIKNIHQNWNGIDFPSFLESQSNEFKKYYKFINKDVRTNQSLLFKDFGGEQNFRNLWNMFKITNPFYLKTDLFNTDDVNVLLNSISCEKPFFNYSNIFATDFTILNHSLEEIQDYYQEFLKTIKTQFPNSITYGCDPLGNWVFS